MKAPRKAQAKKVIKESTKKVQIETITEDVININKLTNKQLGFLAQQILIQQEKQAEEKIKNEEAAREAQRKSRMEKEKQKINILINSDIGQFVYGIKNLQFNKPIEISLITKIDFTGVDPYFRHIKNKEAFVEDITSKLLADSDANLTPIKEIPEINALFTEYDNLADKYGEKKLLSTIREIYNQVKVNSKEKR